MEVLVRSEIIKHQKLADLMKEGDEIVAIVVRSKKTARARGKAAKADSRPKR